MSADTITLTLPLPPNRGNARWHWRTENRKKKAYWSQLNTLRYAGTLPEPWRDTPALVGVRVTLYVWARMDRDNAMARMKWVMDWLEAWEYIANDGAGVKWAGLPEQVIDRKDPRVEVTLTALRWHEDTEAA